MNYLLDGRCSISNNIARPYAVGRKNFLFPDTVKDTRVSAIIYSLVGTAKLNNLNIYAYLETILLYMPDYKNVKIAVLAHTARSTRAILPKQESHLAGWLNSGWLN